MGTELLEKKSIVDFQIIEYFGINWGEYVHCLVKQSERAAVYCNQLFVDVT